MIRRLFAWSITLIMTLWSGCGDDLSAAGLDDARCDLT